jgi:hypothetical protein
VEAEQDFFVLIAEMTLTCLPPAALAAAFILKAWFKGRMRAVFAGAAMFLCFVIGAGGLGFSFTNTCVNFLTARGAYGCYCLLAAGCISIRHWFPRGIAVLIAAIPIGLGYFVASMGILGLGFAIGDETRASDSVQPMTPGLTCISSAWGMAGNEGEYIDLYRTWPLIPFVKRDVVSLNDDFGDESDIGQHVYGTCDTALATYERRRSG